MISTGRQIGKTIKSAGRLRTIVSVFARHGFQKYAERAKLGRFLFRKYVPDSENEELERLTTAERVRMSFEQLGPTFIKLGQLLASRPDLVPPDFVEEFKKLHDNVKPELFSSIRPLLDRHFGNFEGVFRTIDEIPLASASIAQVHHAILKDGSSVVVKIQRPGIVGTIREDLVVLYTLANLINRYVPEARVFNPVAIVDEFFKTLELETNFVVEANNILRFRKNFENDARVVIPRVYGDLSGRQILVMEQVPGRALSQLHAGMNTEVIYDPTEIVRLGLRTFFRMVFQHRFFHGDLHAGNMFILPDNRIGLVDFGVVGRLSEQTRDAIANMLVALASEEYEVFAETILDLSAYNENTDSEKFARALRDLIAPYFGLSFKNVNLGKLLMDSTALAAKHSVSMPSDLMLFFKALLTVEGMGRLIIEDFDILSFANEFSGEIVSAKYDPERLVRELANTSRDSIQVLRAIPRQLKTTLRKWNQPGYSSRVRVENLDEIRRTLEKSSNLLFMGLIVGSLVLSGSIALHFETSTHLLGLPVVSALSYLAAFALGGIAFLNYIRRW